MHMRLCDVNGIITSGPGIGWVCTGSWNHGSSLITCDNPIHEADTPELPEQPPPCENHVEVQHRDGKPPWCKSCGWHRGRPAVPPMKIAARGTIPDGEATPKIY